MLVSSHLPFLCIFVVSVEKNVIIIRMMQTQKIENRNLNEGIGER